MSRLKSINLLLLTLFSVSVATASAAPSKAALQNLLNIAEQAQLSEDLPRAESDYKKALGEALKFGVDSAEVQACEAHLATLYVLQGKLSLAEPHYLRAKDIAVKIMKNGKGDPESFVLLDDLSDAYQMVGASTETEKCYEHCFSLRKAISPKHKLLPNIEVYYGEELVKRGKVAEGVKYLQQGYARSISLAGAKSGATGKLALTIANVYNGLSRWQEAEKYCADSETVARSGAAGGAVVVANVARLHGMILTKLGRFKEAELEIKSAEIIHKQMYGTENFEYAYDLVCMARILLETHKLSEAESAINQALNTFRKNPASMKSVQVEALELASKIAQAQHKTADASKWQAQLKVLAGKH